MPTLSHFWDLFLNKILDLRKKGQDVSQCYFDLYKPFYIVRCSFFENCTCTVAYELVTMAEIALITEQFRKVFGTMFVEGWYEN